MSNITKHITEKCLKITLECTLLMQALAKHDGNYRSTAQLVMSTHDVGLTQITSINFNLKYK